MSEGVGQVYDAKWFPRLRDIYEGVPARLVIQGYNHARDRFLRGEDQNPIFSYRVNDDQKYHEKVRALEELQIDIENSATTPETVKKLYIAKIAEKRLLLEMVRSSYLVVNASSEAERIESTQRYRDISEMVFGPVEPEVFAQACSVSFAQLTAAGSSAEGAPYQRTHDLLEKVASRKTQVAPLHIAAAREAGAVITDQSTVRAFFKEALAQHGASHWRVQYGNRTRTGFVVKSKSHRIIIPNATALKSRRLGSELTERKLQALIEHELTHVLRYEHGVRSSLQLLALGLPGYLRGEEGYATYREQLIDGADDYSGNKLYVAAGLAAGLDRGGEPRNFREVYEIMKDLYQALHPTGDFQADLVAFKLCSTLFKGTNGVDRGVFLTLQTCYREGNIKVHEVLRQTPAWQKYALLGKFDFTNPEHVTALQDIGVLPSVIA